MVTHDCYHNAQKVQKLRISLPQNFIPGLQSVILVVERPHLNRWITSVAHFWHSTDGWLLHEHELVISTLTLPPGYISVSSDGHRSRGHSALHVQGLLQPGGGGPVATGQTQSLQLRLVQRLRSGTAPSVFSYRGEIHIYVSRTSPVPSVCVHVCVHTPS